MTDKRRRKCIIIREYVNGVRGGKYTEIYGHKRITCTYVNDILHGKYEKTRRDVVIISCMYSYGQRRGLYIRNFRNGSVTDATTNKVTCHYRNGKLHGNYTKNYLSDSATNAITPYIQCRYNEGMKQGEYMQFH